MSQIGSCLRDDSRKCRRLVDARCICGLVVNVRPQLAVGISDGCQIPDAVVAVCKHTAGWISHRHQMKQRVIDEGERVTERVAHADQKPWRRSNRYRSGCIAIGQRLNDASAGPDRKKFPVGTIVLNIIGARRVLPSAARNCFEPVINIGVRPICTVQEVESNDPAVVSKRQRRGDGARLDIQN